MLPTSLPTTHVHKFVVYNLLQKPTPRSAGSPRLPTRKQQTGRRLNTGSSTVSKARPAERTNASLTNTLLETGGDEGGGINPPPTYTAEDGNGGFFEHNPLLEVLVKGGVALSELPLDLQEALKGGLLSVKDIHQWVSISSTPLLGSLCRAAPAIRDRLMGNPRFLIQMAAELAVGLSAKAAAEMKARGDRCFKEELPFFLSDMALEAIADIALVTLLSPRRSFKPLPYNALAKGIAKLPGHAMQRGSYSATQRAFTILYRGAQFFVVGFMTSVIGHSITKYAVENQPGPKTDVHLAPVLDNSLGFGSYMGLSSNIRYQSVNCLEDRFLDMFIQNKAVALLATLGLRFSNCYLGSEQWLWFAKAMGLQ